MMDAHSRQRAYITLADIAMRLIVAERKAATADNLPTHRAIVREQSELANQAVPVMLELLGSTIEAIHVIAESQATLAKRARIEMGWTT